MKSILLVFFLSVLTCAVCQQAQQKALPPAPSADYKRAVSLLNRRQDSAYFYLNRVVNLSSDSLQISQAYNVMAVIENREGDYYGAQEHLLTSIKYLHPGLENDDFCLVADYNVLGNTSLNLKNYDTAIDYYDRELALAKVDRTKTVALNNKAKVYQEQKRYGEAIAIYNSILGNSRKDKKEYARVLSNLASVRWMADSSFQAAPDLLAALQIRKDEKDDWGLNSSYAHLADYYMKSRPDSALLYAREMYAVASRLQSSEDKLEALEKLILSSPGKVVKPLFTEYRRLKDSVESAKNGSKNQFALIRYDVQQNKADNLRLQGENAEKKAQILQQKIAIATGILIFALLGIWSISWYRKRKQKMEWEKERAREVERFQLSQKVHDVVANGIYQVVTKVENRPVVDHAWVTDQLWNLYEKSRDISHEPTSSAEKAFPVRLAEMLSPYASEGRKVLIAGNEEHIWVGVDNRVKAQMEPILQELMVNMDKHSGATNVVVRFERSENGLKLYYKDDGVGWPTVLRLGKGLTSTENRITGMGGQIIFDADVVAGVTIRIYLPNV